jgi:ribose 5-phosphate isomerase A
MPDAHAPPDLAVLAVARRAAALVADGAKIGLGTGRAAGAFVDELGARVRQGLRIAAAATSEATAGQARALGIEMIELDEDVILDVTVDGADEVAPNLDLVKGWGGALVRERIVAASSRRQVILVGPEKLVERLGQRGRIPVEVIPLARGLVSRELRRLGLTPAVRLRGDGTPAHTDNGNLTLDCAPAAPLADAAAARALEATVLAVAGVVDTGLFLGTAERVLIGHPDGRIEVRTREGGTS